MKICVITSPFCDLPPNAVGAVEKLFHQLAGEWAKNGYEITFVCSDGGDNPLIKYIRLGKYKRTGRTLTDLPFDLLYSLKAVLAVPKCDILLCNTFWSPVFAPLLRWKYKKLVYGVHRYPKGQFGLYRFVHSFICVSTAIGEAVKVQCKSAANRVCVICNPIDTSVFRPCKEKEHDGNVVSVVYTGRVAREKGIVYLARAVKQLSEDVALMNGRKMRLILVGSWESAAGGGGETYRNEIMAAFPETELVGPVFDSHELADNIRSADVYCYPTIAEKGEAMPVAPLEAMACGVPVVLPRFACFSDYANDGVNCLMYDEPTQIAGAIKHVLCDIDYARKLSAQGAQSVDVFSIDKVAKRYISEFQKEKHGN